MTRFGLFGGTALAAIFIAATASADVTADEVWQSWVDYYTDLGQPVTSGASSMSGDTLVVPDVLIAGETPDGTFTLSVAEVRLKEMGNGTVEITTSEQMPMVVTTRPETGETVDMTMMFRHSGMATLVSGSAGDMTYDMTAPEIGFGIDGMTVDGEAIGMVLNATMKTNKAVYRMIEDGGRDVTSQFSAEALEFDMAAQDPESSGQFTLKGTLGDLASTSEMTVPEGVDMQDMAAAVRAGFDLDGSLSYGAGDYTFDFVDGSDQAQGTLKANGGELKVTMGPDGLDYSANGKGTELSVTSAQIPFPINASIAETGFRLAMPLMKSDEAKPFGMLVKLVDLEVSEAIWSMVDPMEQLPRDPATLILDVTGTAKMLVDLIDEEFADAEAPGEVESVDINELQLTFAGAELTGEGAFTFDNADMSMGYPKPLGAVDLALKGGNALLDKLVAMGLVPEDQAMGGRMMLGMFTVPAGDDELTSKIEFRDDGGLYANGQRLQ